MAGKRYVASKAGESGRGWPADVWVVYQDGRKRPLRHEVRHSPTGFSWGYAGSGPAELARCIFLDLFGADLVDAEGNPAEWGDPVTVGYQAFKFAKVANWPQSAVEVTIGEDEIRSWLREHALREARDRATYGGPDS